MAVFPSKKSFYVIVKGIVQGVGFRPFIYKEALKCQLKGDVSNTGEGVFVHIEGREASIRDFLKTLQSSAPKLSQIDTITIEEQPLRGYKSFEILQSSFESKSTSISPDIAVCGLCLDEMNNAKNRRFGYPLINCTECGPRYSIMKTLPYDRSNTSMNFFKMCEACEVEYRNPHNRRYHAQPISCYDCGPTLKLYDNRNELLEEGSAAIKRVAQLLEEGNIVAIKGIGGFHLMCNATDSNAIATLRERKRRPKKPFAVMVPNLSTITCNSQEKLLLESKERPIVLLTKSSSMVLAQNIAPDIDRIGVMLPYSPLHHCLFKYFKYPIVATSANRNDEPIYYSYVQIQSELNNVADYTLDINRNIINAVDDSVVQVIRNRRLTLRLGRGYAPLTLPSPIKTSRKILAVGAQQKNSIALAFENKIILSPHIGDLNSLEAFEYFERSVEAFKCFYDFEPDLIVCDRHPNYATTQWAAEQGVEVIQVQHHYAHVLACMEEHQLNEKVLAFSFDGTGYGDDDSIWGGEIFTCNFKSYERIGYFKPFRLLGGDKAVKEPRRMALSLLFECYELNEVTALNLPYTAQEIILLHKVWQKGLGLNAPLSSSVGRLFDAVASLMNLLHVNSYEGQSGLLIESQCHDETALAFSYEIKNGIIDWMPMIKEILKENEEKIADRFINTLVDIMVAFAQKELTLSIIFAGGVFQNSTLLIRCMKRFEDLGRRCYFQERTPINDGSIALGQIAYALHHSKILEKYSMLPLKQENKL